MKTQIRLLLFFFIFFVSSYSFANIDPGGRFDAAIADYINKTFPTHNQDSLSGADIRRSTMGKILKMPIFVEHFLPKFVLRFGDDRRQSPINLIAADF